MISYKLAASVPVLVLLPSVDESMMELTAPLLDPLLAVAILFTVLLQCQGPLGSSVGLAVVMCAVKIGMTSRVLVLTASNIVTASSTNRQDTVFLLSAKCFHYI